MRKDGEMKSCDGESSIMRRYAKDRSCEADVVGYVTSPAETDARPVAVRAGV